MSFGVSHRFGPGQLTLFENNAFDTYAGILATDTYARPLPLSDGLSFVTSANPLTPRTIFASYSVAIGGPAPGPAFKGRGAARVAQAPSPEPSASAAARRIRFTSNPPPPGDRPARTPHRRAKRAMPMRAPQRRPFTTVFTHTSPRTKPARNRRTFRDLAITAQKTAAGATAPYYLVLRPTFARGNAGAKRQRR